MNGTFAERLAVAIQPGDVVMIERPMPGKELHVSTARLVDGYDKPLRGRARTDAEPSPNALAKAIEAASAKITSAVDMIEEAQGQD